MESIIEKREEYDQIIIDEADDCIMNEGFKKNEESQKFEGFWDVLAKPTILMTATMNQSMEDLMMKVYNIRRDMFHTYEGLRKEANNDQPVANITYEVYNNFDDHDDAVVKSVK